MWARQPASEARFGRILAHQPVSTGHTTASAHANMYLIKQTSRSALYGSAHVI